MISILTLLLVLAIIGVVAWFLTTLPMPPAMKTLIVAVAIILSLILCLNQLGVVGPIRLR